MITINRSILFCTVLAAFWGTPAPTPAAETVTITEFVASNNGGLQDEDGTYPDWIEIFNSGITTVNLDGWFLTDSIANLTKWRLPATNIAPNGFVIVFASGKNRAVAGAPLHTSFSLSAGGEYLALVHPDGTTIANEFAPAFPGQIQNVSYGIGQNLQVTKLLSNTGPARVFVAPSGALGTTWTATDFDMSGTFIPGGTNYNPRFVSMTGTIGSPARVLIYLGEVGDVYIDDLFLANGTNAEAGTNLIINGNFETPLLGAPSLTNFFTSVGSYHATSVINATNAHSGSNSLHVISTNNSSFGLTRVLYKDIPGATNGQVCTLSFWYRPTFTATNLYVRMQSSSIGSSAIPSAVMTPVVTPDLTDAVWLNATNGVGYETYVAGFSVRNIRATVGIGDLATADTVLAMPAMQSAVFTETRGVINYLSTGGAGNFGGDFPFPGFVIGQDDNNFVIEATGIITIPTSGFYTFGVNSDDGFRLAIGANSFEYPSGRGASDTLATFNLAAGDYSLRLVTFEGGGGASAEAFGASGSHGAFNASFRLLGNTAGGGLAVNSLPTGSGGNGGGSLRQYIKTDVQTKMLNKNAAAYIRLPFAVTNPAAYSTLTLRMQYDDGFVAYLNGTEIARRAAPAGTPAWNAPATTNRSTASARIYEEMDVTGSLGLLLTGTNWLAVQGLRAATNAPDFLIVAELVENKVLGLANHYFSTPSPGAVNGSGFYAYVDNLKFTPGRGWFDTTNISVTITSATPGVTIRYTLDGSVPTTSYGSIYTAGGIPLTNTTVIRALGYRDGFEPTVPETHSYIFLNGVQRQTTNVNWLGGSSGNYSMDTNLTMGPIYGPTFRADLTNVPTLSIVTTVDDMFGPNGVWSNPGAYGVAYERVCSVEYMRPDGKKGFNIGAGIRIQGGASRGAIKHGFRLLFKEIYGASKLDYELYPDSPVQKFDTLVLHHGFNDWIGYGGVFQRDQWCRDAQNAMGGYGPHGTYVHLYLNGVYWGLFNIGEKGDGSYAAHHLGGEKEEYDAFNSDELVDGDATAWNNMFAIANAGITTDLAYNNLSQYLNIPNFIDYMMMNFYSATGDWPWHNWNAARRRVPGAGFHFFSWDSEFSFGYGSDINTDRTGLSDGAPGVLYSKLRAHPEFNMLFADHAQKHLFNGGALTPGPTQARWMNRKTEIERGVVAELARWLPGSNKDNWNNTEAYILTWFPQRTSILINQLKNAGLMPALNAPTFAPFGGLVPPGFALNLTNANATGAIHFTTDGSDPRLWGGALAPSAQLYTGPLLLTNALYLRARVRNGAAWSPVVEATFYVVQDYTGLEVTEIMYSPPVFGTNAADELEFLELKNTSTNTFDLSGLAFTDGLTFSFTNGTTLAPGAFFVLARNAAAFAQKYPGLPVHGIYTGRLDNGGEQLTLTHTLATNIFSFSYNNQVPWPITPDGHGFSLVRANLTGSPGSSSSWRPSALLGGSPGADDPAVSIAPIVIHEILTHTDLPQLDAIELHNPTATNVNLGGWYLTDAPSLPKQFRIPNGTIIPPGGFAVFYETDFNAVPGVPPSFALSSHGESLLLFSGDATTNLTGYSYSFDYGAAANGVSFGRYLNSAGDEFWPALSALTLGGSNAAPLVGPLVLNEIMFHPAAGDDEFVEIYNLSNATVPLYDPAFPTNSWKLTGLGYTFSNTLSLPPHGFLLVVATDPAAFRAKYTVPAPVQIVGPFAGVLQDSGERLRLERPDAPDANGTPYLVVDEVRYNDKLPWPAGTDGDGPSLQRLAPNLYGNEPTNWFASGSTPGLTNVVNQPPLVALTAPTNGATYVMPAHLPLAAAASDPDGSVIRVEFYNGAIKLGEATNAPYAFTWSNAPAGQHVLVAKARDNKQSVNLSTPVTITVNPPPVGTGLGLRGDYYNNADFTGTKVRRVDPVVDFNWGAGSPDLAIGPDTFSARWTGQVQPRFSEGYTFHSLCDDGVRLYVNNQLIIDHFATGGDWSGVISLQAGELYDLRLEYNEGAGSAQVNLSWSAPSVPKEIIPATQLYPPLTTNLPPLVTLTSPANGTVFVATSPVSFSADAVDPDGSIAKVEFFANGTKLGEDTVPPHTLAWTNNLAGSFTLTALATDDEGASRTSAPVVIQFVAGFTTNLTLIPTGAVWKYLDTGTDQSNAWSTLAYNATTWNSGPAQLGYGDGDEATVVGFGPNGGAKYITTYFRRTFVVSNHTTFTALNLRVQRDDGVVVHLNGSEVFRDNMPAGAIGYLTPAATTTGDETGFYPSAVNSGYLLSGTNVIAVEIHQAGGGSSDISFNFELTGVQSYLAPAITTQPQSQTLGAGSVGALTVVATGTDPLRYQWRHNGTNLAGATNAALLFPSITATQAGNYTVTISNLAGGLTSAVATLTVSVADTDGDGLPDVWETAHGLNPNLHDAALDPDQDGMTNLQEFLAGTNPQDPNSYLKVTDIIATPGTITLRFPALSNHTYSVLYNPTATAGAWLKLTNLPAHPTNRLATITDPNPSPTNRFYRLTTPSVPFE